VTNEPSSGNSNNSDDDRYFRRMMKWVVIALIATVALAILVVEFTLRLLNR
jgi:hypothetical protein